MRVRSAWSVPAALSVALVAAAAAFGAPQDEGGEAPIVRVVEARTLPARVLPGGSTRVLVTLVVAEGWHIYGVDEKSSLPTVLSLDAPPGWRAAGETSESVPPHPMEFAGETALVHEGKITFDLPVEAAPDAEHGKVELAGTVSFLPCDDRVCVPTDPLPWKAEVEVTGAVISSAQFVPASVAPGGDTNFRIAIALQEPWHTYAQEHTDYTPPTFEWTLPEGVTVGPLTERTQAHEIEMSWGEKFRVHEGGVELGQALHVDESVAEGSYPVTGRAKWQRCTDAVCVNDEDVPVEAVLVVSRTPAAAEVPPVAVVRSGFTKDHTTRSGTAVYEVELAIAQGWGVVAPGGKGGLDLTVEGEDAFTPVSLTVEPAPAAGAQVLGPGRLVLRRTVAVSDGVAIGPLEVDVGVSWTAQSGTSRNAGRHLDTTSLMVRSPGLTAKSVLVAIFAGLITLLTPCVFPLLPVTVSFFSKQQGPALPRALVYGFGIVFTVTVIGLIFKAGVDELARGPWFNLAIGLLFLALGMSLFGLFNLRLPSFLIDASSERSSAGGLLGPFFMAVTLALTSFSCSAPFLPILFADFESGQYVAATSLLVIYSGTMAAPFFVCSLVPSLLKSMPNAGSWMNAVKITMGFVEFALAFKFLRTMAIGWGWEILPRGLVLAVWVASALLAAMYLFGKLGLKDDPAPQTIGILRMMFGWVFLALALWLLPGVFNRPVNNVVDAFLNTEPHELWTPELAAGAGRGAANGGSNGGGGAQHAEGIEWPRNDWDGALARAADKRRPVLFDFTGVG